MRCRTAERRLSDGLDGALSPGAQARLEAHLRTCPACRAVREALARLQAEAAAPVERPEADWAGFERRLASRLDREPAGPAAAGRPFPVPRPVWAGAVLAAIAAAALLFGLLRPAPRGTMAWMPEGDPLAPLFLEAELDPELEGALERQVRAEIEALSPAPGADSAALAAADPLFWESVSDEELEAIVAELERETDSGGPK